MGGLAQRSAIETMSGSEMLGVSSAFTKNSPTAPAMMHPTVATLMSGAEMRMAALPTVAMISRRNSRPGSPSSAA